MVNDSARRPVFAVVTPSYNQVEFLEQTIQSVISQDGLGRDFDLHYAVVDGGSTDGSREIIQKYQSDLTYWCCESDRGQTHAINKGFARVSGDVCAYINSDDYYLPGAFRRAARAFAENPGVGLVHGIIQTVNADGSPRHEQLADINNLAEILDLWRRWLRPGGCLNFIQPEVFWSGQLAKQLGPFEERLHYTMDFNYWLRGFASGMTVKTIDEPLAAFRVHESQKTTDQDASILELIDNIQPYIHAADVQISHEHREHLIRHTKLTRRMIAESAADPAARVRSLLSLAAGDPKLWQSKFFWRYLRRSGRRALLPRRCAA